MTHNVTFARITFRILLPRVARREVVNCRMGKVKIVSQSRAFRTFHFAFYFPHSAFYRYRIVTMVTDLTGATPV